MSVLAVPISQSFEVDKNKVKDFDNQSHHKKQWILDRLSKYNKNEIKWDKNNPFKCFSLTTSE